MAKRAANRIIDAHSHIFPRLGTAPRVEDKRRVLKLWQYHLRDATRFWRKSDHVLIEQRLLDFPSDDIEEMPDLGFRLGRYGQAEFSLDGVDYYAQVVPPGLEDLAAAPERVVAEMNGAGVETAVLQSDHAYGPTLNEYYADALRRFPGRFIALAQIEEPEAYRPRQLARLEAAVLQQGCQGLYFTVEVLEQDKRAPRLDDAVFEPLWDLVRRLHVPVFFYLDARKRDRVGSFMRCAAEADHWAQKHPDIVAVITHGAVPAAIIHQIGMPPEVWSLLKHANTYLEVLMPAKFPEYPYPQGQELLKRLCDGLGVEKLLWGSDMPFGAEWCTYRQAIDYIRLHCNFLSECEKGLILGGNAARLFGLDGQG